MTILKYPRTPHITGSRVQAGDGDLHTVAREIFVGLPVVVEEKLDGSNCGISFNGGELVLQSRGHVLTGGPRERQFDLFKRWAHHHQAVLRSLLGERYVMYGEWLYARHTIPYDQLPHYFLEFDILDRHTGSFLSTPQRHLHLAGTPISSVPVLAADKVTHLEQLITRSTCSSTETMEGLYIKHETEVGVVSRYKFVRASFLQAVSESGEHWMDRPIEANQLREGIDLFT